MKKYNVFNIILKPLSWYAGIILFIIVFFNGYVADFLVFIATLFFIVCFALNLKVAKEKTEEKEKQARKKLIPQIVTIEERKETVGQIILRHVNIRITLMLRESYPEAIWGWLTPNPENFVETGGWTRIKTENTGKFNFAEIFTDPKTAALKINFLQVTDINNVKEDSESASVKTDSKGIQPVLENEDTGIEVFDVDNWYFIVGRRTLLETVTELNAQGQNNLYIKPDGALVTISKNNEQQQWGVFASFPQNKYWKLLVEKFENENLMAEIEDNKILIFWA